MPRKKKRTLAEQAEALWPLGWKEYEYDEDEVITADVGAVDLRIARLEKIQASAYNNEMPLIDGDEFDTLEEVIEAMYETVTDFYSIKVPALRKQS